MRFSDPDAGNILFRFRVKQSYSVDFMLQPAHASNSVIFEGFESHGGRRGKKN